MKSSHLAGLFLASVACLCCVLGSSASAYPIISGDLVFDESGTPIVSGSGRLDIILFTGNSVANAAGLPNPNGAMPSGGDDKSFAGDWPVMGNPETLTVQELLDYLHYYRGPDQNALEIEIDVNEPGTAGKGPIQIDLFSITIGGTTLSSAEPVTLFSPNTGSGHSDFVIRGPNGGIDLTQYNPGDVITMHLEASQLESGYEELFVSAMPEPATFGLLGLGLVGLVARRRPRRK